MIIHLAVAFFALIDKLRRDRHVGFEGKVVETVPKTIDHDGCEGILSCLLGYTETFLNKF